MRGNLDSIERKCEFQAGGGAIAGYGYLGKPDVILAELRRGGALQFLLLRYVQALMTPDLRQRGHISVRDRAAASAC